MLVRKPGATTMAMYTALILFIFVVVFTALLSGTYLLTRPRLEASALAEKRRMIDAVLPPTFYDNDLIGDAIDLPPSPQLGLDAPTQLYRARLQGAPAALVFEAVAHDGYSGDIRLLIGVLADGRISGVRVTAHKETPGLGDYIDPKRDRNKAHPWIEQFVGLSAQNPSADGWRVKKDGGRIDSVAGATISARAVAQAVHKAVLFAEEHRQSLFDQPIPAKTP